MTKTKQTTGVAALNEMAMRVYEKSNRLFRPLYPWVFVYVLPREQKYGSVIAPDIEQNKPVHEGIVLAIWQPFEEERRCYDAYEAYDKVKIKVASSLKAGDHVLFPHWAGQPIHGFSDKHFRVVKERDFKMNEDGGILGVVEYDEKDSIAKQLNEIINDPDFAYYAIENICKRFILVDREKRSATLSGR